MELCVYRYYMHVLGPPVRNYRHVCAHHIIVIKYRTTFPYLIIVDSLFANDILKYPVGIPLEKFQFKFAGFSTQNRVF